jgi:aerobic-type carbon monoxide dehydrogenase small subunit (CoxS/CutS family)
MTTHAVHGSQLGTLQGLRGTPLAPLSESVLTHRRMGCGACRQSNAVPCGVHALRKRGIATL